jgi:hypothetical protein
MVITIMLNRRVPDVNPDKQRNVDLEQRQALFPFLLGLKVRDYDFLKIRSQKPDVRLERMMKFSLSYD